MRLTVISLYESGMGLRTWAVQMTVTIKMIKWTAGKPSPQLHAHCVEHSSQGSCGDYVIGVLGLTDMSGAGFVGSEANCM